MHYASKKFVSEITDDVDEISTSISGIVEIHRQIEFVSKLKVFLENTQLNLVTGPFVLIVAKATLAHGNNSLLLLPLVVINDLLQVFKVHIQLFVDRQRL